MIQKQQLKESQFISFPFNSSDDQIKNKTTGKGKGKKAKSTLSND